MMRSQNGWPASSNRRDIAVEAFEINGVSFPGGVKAGDVTTVFAYVVEQFHANVEPLVLGWCWGWAWKNVAGGDDISNHASGTAVDINAPDHGLGKENTFDGRQEAAIRTIVHACAGIVRWGGDYDGRKDEMHFEIVGDETDVASLATAIRNNGGPTVALTANDANTVLMGKLSYTYPSAAAAKAAGLPIVNGKQELVETHPFAEWFGVMAVRVRDLTDQVATLTELVLNMKAAGK